jgi:hypothetical protein
VKNCGSSSGARDKTSEIFDFYYPLSAFFESPNWIQKNKAALNFMGINAGPSRKSRLDIATGDNETLKGLLKRTGLIQGEQHELEKACNCIWGAL